MNNKDLRDILVNVSSPFRYIGGEAGSIVKDWGSADARVCLCFPNIYEMGMSHIGLSILYNIVNDENSMLAERCFMPWPDMQAELVKRNMPLFSLESKRGLGEFDIVGFSLAYELTYTSVLKMLELSHIPIRANARDDNHPIVIAGGVCTCNPAPISVFFDAIVIGDGEEVILKITNAVRDSKKQGLSRRETLSKLSEIEGVYCPSITDNCSLKKGRAIIPDLNNAPFPSSPIVPYAATHDRVAVEVARGCARGCRFCNAGYIYRPVRQRNMGNAAGLACAGLANTGSEELSFLSLSIGDWAPLEPAMEAVHANCKGLPFNVSFPSLRAESLTKWMIDAMGAGRSGSFTIAPEAGTLRMRKFINKGNTDEDLYASVEKVFASRWHIVKLYFMLGLPCETEKDMDGIVETANKCLDIGRKFHRRPEVTVSASTFVPKAHTPFQWERQVSIEETLELQRQLKKRLRRPGLFFRWHNAEMSFLEGVFSRGGAELADVIERAFKNDAQMDGWDEFFNMGAWMKAFEETGIEPSRYLRERQRDEEFPWDFLNVGPPKKFLWRERERASALEVTPDCTKGKCQECGVCDFKEIKNRIAENRERRIENREQKTKNRKKADINVYRIKFEKTGLTAFLGPKEALDIMRKAMRSAGVPLLYSEGYHPRPRVSAGPSVSTGMESFAEYLDVSMAGKCDEKGIQVLLAGRLPSGVRIVECKRCEAGAPSIEEATETTTYEIDCAGLEKQAASALERYASGRPLSFTRVRKGNMVDVDLRDYIAGLALREGHVLVVTVGSKKPYLKTSEIVRCFLDVPEETVRLMKMKKVDVKFKIVKQF